MGEKFYFDFKSGGYGKLEIEEPKGYSTSSFELKQKPNGYARDLFFGGGDNEFELSSRLKHHLDKKFYVLQKQCLDCVAKFETQLRMDGKWEEYEQNIIKNNAKAYVNDIEQAFEEYLNTNESFVTEAGDVENWNGNINKEQLKNEFRTYIEALKNNMKL